MALPVVWPNVYYFYPIGNTSPVCLTQSLSPEQDAKILLLGCGDPRNILYTLYADGADLRDSGRKFDITCNDMEPAVLARNILLLTLVLDDEYPRNASKLWDLFYHFFLDKPTWELLVCQSRRLAQLSTSLDAWHSSQYSSFIKISSRYTLYELNRLWRLYEATTAWTEAEVVESRSHFVSHMRKSVTENTYNTGGRAAGPLWQEAMDLVAAAHRHFWKTGTTFEFEEDTEAACHLNPMFLYTGQTEDVSVHETINPLAGLPLAPSITPTDLYSSRRSSKTMFDLFRDARLQFRSWCDVARTCFAQGNGRVILRFLVGDALAVCRTFSVCAAEGRTTAQEYISAWKPHPLVLDDAESSTAACRGFNVIDTSNLCDHVGMLNILIATIPLLRRHPSSTLLTETLISSSDEPLKSFLGRMCGDPSTVFMLIDLVPTSYLSGFTTHSNIHEIEHHYNTISQHPDPLMPQYAERMTWKILSLGDDRRTSMSAEPHQLAATLHGIYIRMFLHENLDADVGKSMASRRVFDIFHHCRRTFALFVDLLTRRITTNWDQVIETFLSHVRSSPPESLSMAHYQELLLHLHLLGFHTESDWIPNGAFLQSKKGTGKFRRWSQIPSVVCVTFVVPRRNLEVLEKDPHVGNPYLHCLLTESFACPFTPLQLVFGTAASTGVGEGTQVVISPDPKGQAGSCDLVVAFWAPSWLIAHSPSDTEVALWIPPTPTAVLHFMDKLGAAMRLYHTSVTSKNVLVSANAPRLDFADQPSIVVSPQLYRSAVRTGPPNPLQPKFALTIDASSLRITSVTAHVDVTEPEAKTDLGKRETSITAEADRDQGPGAVTVCIGESFKQVLCFPALSDVSTPKLRVARRSCWVEVVCAVPESGTHFLHDFPILQQEGGLTAWNVHYTNPNRLPALHLDEPKRLSWLDHHTADALSDREGTEVRLNQERSSLTQVKFSLHAMTLRVSGVRPEPELDQQRVFTLNMGPTGGIDTIFFVADVRLDLPSHTIVLDAFVLTYSEDFHKQLDPVIRELQRSRSVLTCNASTEEILVWKRWLPTLVERCRKWSHRLDCAYALPGAHIPLSTAFRVSPICACGKGIAITAAFSAKKEWEPFAPHVTRVAISPLFALSYLEDVAGNYRDAVFGKYQSSAQPQEQGKPQCGHCAKTLPVGKVSSCSACRSVSYCNKECQVAHWKTHKTVCRKV